MSTPGQPPRSTDGPFESQDNEIPEGVLLARYHMSILVTTDFLRSLEKLCWKCGMNREQFNHAIFAKGVDALTEELRKANDDEFMADFAMIAPLGRKLRERDSEEW